MIVKQASINDYTEIKNLLEFIGLEIIFWLKIKNYLSIIILIKIN